MSKKYHNNLIRSVNTIDLSKNNGFNTASKESAKADNVPEISVIIPAYNLENEIERCIKSVLDQEIDDMEIIVVNDCSTDKTEAVVKELAKNHKEIRLLSFPENRGVAAARNAALDVAKGEFIHFCDGDDAVPDGAYNELLSIAETKNADIVTGNYSRMYPSEGGVIRPFSHYTAPTGRERCFESGNTMIWNKLYRREVIENNHIRYDEQLKYYEDYLFFHKVLLASQVVEYTDSNVYIYTEPVSRPFGGAIRYASIECAMGLDRAWRSLACSDIDKKELELWKKAYIWNLSWFYNYSWKMIQNVSVRKNSFEILKKLIVWMDSNSEFGKLDEAENAQFFYDLFHVDYFTFSTISFEDYMIQLALVENLRPREPVSVYEQKKMKPDEHETFLADTIDKQLNELEKIYSAKLTNKRVWRENYWNQLDSILNDYWRNITDSAEKERLFKRIQTVAANLSEENSVCAIPNPDVLWRVKQVFCMDFATFQMVSFSQYQMICAKRPESVQYVNSNSNYSERIIIQSDPSLAFISACRNGKVGMKMILRAIKEWFKFKLRKNK